MKNTCYVHRHEDFVIENTFEGDDHVRQRCLRLSHGIGVGFLQTSSDLLLLDAFSHCRSWKFLWKQRRGQREE